MNRLALILLLMSLTVRATDYQPSDASALATALSAVTAGDSITLTNSIYTSATTFTLANSGTPGNPITISSAVGSILTNTAVDTTVLQLSSVSNVVVRGLTIKARPDPSVALGANYHALYVNAAALVRDVTIEQCDVSGAGRGIFLSGAGGATNFIVRSNFIHDCAFYGAVALAGVWSQYAEKYTNTVFSFNTVSNITGNANNQAQGIALVNGYGGTIYGNVVIEIGNASSDVAGGPPGILTWLSRYCYIGYNVVGNVHASLPSAVDGIGINIGHGTTLSIIEHNYVYNCDGPGLYSDVESSPPSVPNIDNTWADVFRYNIVVNCGKRWLAGGFAMSAYAQNPTGFTVHNNTFVQIYTNAVLNDFSSTNDVIFFNGRMEGTNYFANNILVVSNGVALHNAQASGQGYWGINGNQYYDLGGTARFNWAGTGYNGLAALKAGTSWESGTGYEADPQLRNILAAGYSDVHERERD